MLLRIFLIVLFYTFATTGSVAHSKLTQSVPAEGATTKAGLSEIKLSFSKPVRLVLVKVKNTSSNADVKSDFKPARTFTTFFPFKVSPLHVGPHLVNWTAVSKDGHVMKGTLSFTIAK